MQVQRVAAFSRGQNGGNPAGVVLLDEPIAEADMRRIAQQVGYSETAFAVAQAQENTSWRVRYFSPESEIPFCGHATIALGSVLGETFGPGTYELHLNHAVIAVTTRLSESGTVTELTSPETRSELLGDRATAETLALFGLAPSDLDVRLPPARIHGGSDHVVLAVRSRGLLAAMHYDLEEGRDLMRRLGLVTIMLVYVEDEQHFSVRNAFASGGVLEDPATGAAAAAFAGYLRDRHWPHGGEPILSQGDDMGTPCLIRVGVPDKPGSSVRLSGETRKVLEQES